jgi:hypothetical protein
VTPATAAPVRSNEVDLDALAAAARRVIGGDHAVIVLAGADEHAVVAGRDGLLASTLATIAHTRPDDVLDVLDREFGSATSAEAQFDGESYGSVHVVKHARASTTRSCCRSSPPRPAWRSRSPSSPRRRSRRRRCWPSSTTWCSGSTTLRA